MVKLYIANHSDDAAYITSSNLRKLMPDIDHIKPEQYNSLYKNSLKFILSEKELHVLYALREFYKGTYNEIKSTYQRSLNFVYDSKPPAFHKDPQCKYLSGDYTNYAIPFEIKERGMGEILKYKYFFVEHSRLLRDDSIEFEKKINAAFKTSDEISISDKVSYKNSGHDELGGVSISELEDKIDALLRSAEAYKNSNIEIRDIIELLGFGPANSKEAQDPNSPIYKWHHEYKSRLKQLLEKLFKETFAPDMDISKNFLISAGFRPCSHCCTHG